MELESLLIFEFDPQYGFTLAAQHPPDAAGSSAEAVCHAMQGLVPRGSTSEATHVSRAGGDTVVLFHQETIEGEQYLRNNYTFAIGLHLLPNDAGASADAFKRVLHGIGRRLRIAEVEAQFLSLPANKRGRLEELLSRVFVQLSADGCCCSPIDESTGLTMNLKLEEAQEAVDSRSIGGNDVYRRLGHDVGRSCASNDPILSTTLSHIDGRRTLREVAHSGQLSIGLARKAVGRLL